MSATIDPTTGEPLRMGAVVEDRDGHQWRRGRTLWTCLAPVGARYRDAQTGRLTVVARVGRLPWAALRQASGPLRVVDLHDRGASRSTRTPTPRREASIEQETQP